MQGAGILLISNQNTLHLCVVVVAHYLQKCGTCNRQPPDCMMVAGVIQLIRYMTDQPTLAPPPAIPTC